MSYRIAVPRRSRSAPLVAAVALGLLSSVTVAQADDPQQVTLQQAEFAFTPATITINAGQPVVLTLQNTGTLDHDFKSDLPVANLTYQQADNPPDEQVENSASGVLDVDIDSGGTAQVSFVATQSGTYTFYCDVPGHRDAGMVGTLVVN